jgi:hypothetical protein
VQNFQQLCFVALVALPFALVVDFVEQHHGEVAARPALTRLEQEDRSIGEDVRGRGIVGGLDVAGCDGAELLVRFVEAAFCDPVKKRVRRTFSPLLRPSIGGRGQGWR